MSQRRGRPDFIGHTEMNNSRYWSLEHCCEVIAHELAGNGTSLALSAARSTAAFMIAGATETYIRGYTGIVGYNPDTGEFTYARPEPMVCARGFPAVRFDPGEHGSIARLTSDAVVFRRGLPDVAFLARFYCQEFPLVFDESVSSIYWLFAASPTPQAFLSAERWIHRHEFERWLDRHQRTPLWLHARQRALTEYRGLNMGPKRYIWTKGASDDDNVLTSQEIRTIGLRFDEPSYGFRDVARESLGEPSREDIVLEICALRWPNGLPAGLLIKRRDQIICEELAARGYPSASGKTIQRRLKGTLWFRDRRVA